MNRFCKKKSLCILMFYTLAISSFSQIVPQWTDVVNLELNSSDELTKTSADTWDSGAASEEHLPANEDGWIEFVANSTTTARMIGLSEFNEDSHFSTINFAIYLRFTGRIEIYENGSKVWYTMNSLSDYSVGDVFKIERIGNTIYYMRNNETIYTSLSQSSQSLLVDLAVYSSNTVINNISLSNFFTISSPTISGIWESNSFSIYHNTSNVGIGTTNPSEKLEVAGTIYSNKVKVDIDAGTGPDYVFEPSYNLRTLEETETYIKENKHLPEVPSATEMETNGVLLGQMNMLLLKKIEEITLYTIQQEKKIQSQNQKIDNYELTITNLSKQLTANSQIQSELRQLLEAQGKMIEELKNRIYADDKN